MTCEHEGMTWAEWLSRDWRLGAEDLRLLIVACDQPFGGLLGAAEEGRAAKEGVILTGDIVDALPWILSRLDLLTSTVQS